MDELKSIRATPVDTAEKLPWTDPELAQTAIADHTLGGTNPDTVEGGLYRLS